ncbi:MAG: helical backbone metal receptor [Pseudomonadota bacterium]
MTDIPRASWPRTLKLLIPVAIFVIIFTQSANAGRAHQESQTAPPKTQAEIRAISLAPHLTELMFTAGAGPHLVGVVEWSDYPEAALKLPRIGDAFRFDIERIVALDTTHALAWTGGTPMAAVQQLESLGVEVIAVEIQTLDDISLALRRLGRLFNSAETAERAAVAFDQQKQTLINKRNNDPQLALFYQVSERPLFTLGAPHVINEVFALCGARNIFDGLQTEASVVGREAVIAAKPYAIIAGTQHETNAQNLATEMGWPEQPPLGHWGKFEQIPAITCGHAWTVDPALLVRPTPRILDGAVLLCVWIDQIRQQSASNQACNIDHD